MNNREFNQWLDHHKTAYPGLSAWLRTNLGQLDHWERTLSAVTLVEARNASDAMVEKDEQPKGYSEHARWIRRIAMESRGVAGRSSEPAGPQVRDGHLTAHCTRCMDYGVVSVLGPSTIKRLRTNDENHSVLTCAIACDCSRGNMHARKLPRWQAGYMLIRYDDVLDRMADHHEDMWEAALALTSGTVPVCRELTGAELP